MSSPRITDGIVFAAVHLISESGDHFNILATGETTDELIDDITGKCEEEMSYISEIFVTCSDHSYEDALYDAIVELRDADSDEDHE
jgi:hypothetical protein